MYCQDTNFLQAMKKTKENVSSIIDQAPEQVKQILKQKAKAAACYAYDTF